MIGRRFPDYLDAPTPRELQEQIERMLTDDALPENTVKVILPPDWSRGQNTEL